MSQYVCDYRGVHEIQGSTLRHPDEALIVAFGGAGMSETGLRVMPRDMIGYAPILQGITILAGDVAMLPLILKRRILERTVEDTSHVAYRLAAEKANPLTSAQTYWELQLLRAIIYGNGISFINRDDSGRPLPPEMGGLTPLPPESTRPWMDEDGGIWIKCTVQTGPGSTEEMTIHPDDTIHIRGLTHDGYWGYSLRETAEHTIGGGLALRKFGNYSWKNQARPDMLFRHPGVMGQEAIENFKRSVYEEHGGVERVGKMMVLEEGMEAQLLGQTHEQAQVIDLLKMSVEDVSRVLNIPPHMLNLMDRSTFNNIEEQGRNYLNRTLGRWLKKVTTELELKLLTPSERKRYYFLHDVDQLLKGTLKDRAEAGNKLIASRILNPNEFRAMEGWDPYDGGEEYGNPNIDTRQRPEPPEGPDDERNGESQKNGHVITRW